MEGEWSNQRRHRLPDPRPGQRAGPTRSRPSSRADGARRVDPGRRSGGSGTRAGTDREIQDCARRGRSEVSASPFSVADPTKPWRLASPLPSAVVESGTRAGPTAHPILTSALATRASRAMGVQCDNGTEPGPSPSFLPSPVAADSPLHQSVDTALSRDPTRKLFDVSTKPLTPADTSVLGYPSVSPLKHPHRWRL